MIKFIVRMIKYRVTMFKLKLSLCEALDGTDEWISFFTKLVIAYKDYTPDEIRKEFLVALTGKIHDDIQKKKESSNEGI